MNTSKTFVNKRKIYQFEYPADWEIFMADNTDAVVLARLPIRQPPTVQVMVADYQRTLSELLNELYTNTQSQKAGFFRLTHPREFSMSDGQPAGDFLYQNTAGEEPITHRNVIIHLTGSKFVFAYAFAPTGLWKEYEARFDAILDSIREPAAQSKQPGFWKNLLDKPKR